MENFTELCGYNDIQEIFNENQIYQNQELTEQFSIMDNFHETLSVCSDVSSSNSKNERNSYKKQMDADTSIVLRESANERERKRTRAVNEAFENLRMALPSYAVKPCKIQTLKLAIRYINFLHQILNNQEQPYFPSYWKLHEQFEEMENNLQID